MEIKVQVRMVIELSASIPPCDSLLVLREEAFAETNRMVGALLAEPIADGDIKMVGKPVVELIIKREE
jgi:hypothetical protein